MPKEPPGPDILKLWKDGDEEAKSQIWEWLNSYMPGKIYRTSRWPQVVAFDFESYVVEEIVSTAMDQLLGYIEGRLKSEIDFQLASPLALLGFWDLRIRSGVKREISKRLPKPPRQPNRSIRAARPKNTKVIGELALMCHELQRDPLPYKAFRDRCLINTPGMLALFDAWWQVLQARSTDKFIENMEGVVEKLKDVLNCPPGRLYVYNGRLLEKWKKFSKSP